MLPSATKDRIIDVAMEIISTSGVSRLTLELAAQKAKLSKGGILYHFHSKDDLIRAMVDRMIVQCETLRVCYFDNEPEGPYRHARALVRTAFDAQGLTSNRVCGALIAALAVNPALAAPLSQHFDQWIAEIHSDAPNPLLANMVALAISGLNMEKLMGVDIRQYSSSAELQDFILGLLGQGGATKHE